MLLFTNSMILFLATFFILSPHPLMMGVIIIVTTILITILIFITLQLSWVTFMIFLIYLGALLVLFMYVVSLAPNEIFPFNPFKITLTYTLTSTLIMTTFTHSYSNLQAKAFNPFLSYSKLFSSTMFPLTMIAIFSLILTLISVIFISKPKLGTLRNNFY